MKFDKYVKDLLYRYDCVVLPNLGAFITRNISAKIDESSTGANYATSTSTDSETEEPVVCVEPLDSTIILVISFSIFGLCCIVCIVVCVC